MAQRRMFAIRITESDTFRGLTIMAQALYFHMGLQADDDGFVSSVRSLMRSIKTSDKKLKELVAAGLVIEFDDGICLLAHWRVNNYIAPDRYAASFYHDRLSGLRIEDGVFRRPVNAEKPNVDEASLSLRYGAKNARETAPNKDCQQNADKTSTQVRLGKVSKGKVSKGKVSKSPGSLYDDCDAAREGIASAWKSRFGRAITAPELEAFLHELALTRVDYAKGGRLSSVDWDADNEFLALMALDAAIAANAPNLNYIRGVFRTLRIRGIRSKEQYDDYEFAASGP